MVIQELVLFPIETLGLQSIFESLFSYSHNGGTWFISCLMICYLLYPYLQEIILKIDNKKKLLMFLVNIAILLYAPIVIWFFKLDSIYSNPIFRLFEFVLGIILASFKTYFDNNAFKKIMYNRVFVAVVSLILVLVVSFVVKFDIGKGNYMLLSWIGIPCFSCLLVSLSGISFKNTDLILHLSDCGYCMFLAQLFSNKISKILIYFTKVNNNFAIILIGWTCCISIMIILRFIEKKSSQYWKLLLLGENK